MDVVNKVFKYTSFIDATLTPICVSELTRCLDRVYMYVCMGVYMYVCVGVYMYVCIGVYMYVCMGVYMYVCVGVYMYVCMGVYVRALPWLPLFRGIKTSYTI